MIRKNDYGIETEQRSSRMRISRYLGGRNDAGIIHSNYCQKHKTSLWQIIRKLPNGNKLSVVLHDKN